jgi:hypothetical protein
LGAVPVLFLQKVSTLIPRTKFPTPTTADPAPSRVSIERIYPRILSSTLPIMDFREAYGIMAGLKSAGSLRTGISVSLSSEGADAGREGGRRRRETTGFYTTKLRSEIGSV